MRAIDAHAYTAAMAHATFISLGLVATSLFSAPAGAMDAPYAAVSLAPQAGTEHNTQPPADANITQPTGEAAKVDLRPTGGVKGYGAEGSRWIMVTGGWGYAFSNGDDVEGNDYNLAGALSYFVVDNVEVSGELGFWYHDIEGEEGTDFDDEQSGNLSIIFRWHFLNRESWTLFADAGVGLMIATGEVPPGGTDVNFTPRIGAGFTHQIGDSQNRFVVGVRWQHFSNARITGDDDNPGRDDAMLYGGVIFPF